MDRGYVHKLDWARYHFQQLQNDIAPWFSNERYPLVYEPDPDGPYERRLFVERVPPIPINPFSLRVGDVLYSLRSCLDNLAYDLNGKKGPVLGNKSMFPACSDKIDKNGSKIDGASHFAAKRGDWIGAMDAGAQAIIEKLQPYKRGNDYRLSPLWALDHLCNIDKHRGIHLIAITVTGAVLRPQPNIVTLTPIEIYGGRLEAGTIVARFTPVFKDPAGKMDVNLAPAFRVGFSEGAYKDFCVLALLDTIIAHVVRDIIEPLSKFL